MFRKILLFSLTLVMVNFTVCGHALSETDNLKSAGCKTEIYLLKDIAEAYEEQTGKSLRLGSTGNKKAVNLLLEKNVDFTFTCKPIEKIAKGMKLDKEQVSSWKSIAIAKDPIVIVANRGNGITNITKDELTKIYQGQISNWKELNGNNLPILPAYLSEDLESGLVLLFKEFTMGAKGKLTDNAMKAKAPNMLGNYTSVTPGAISFMNYNTYDEKYGDVLKVDGVLPNEENINNGTYPLTATYFLTIDGSNNQAVVEFIEFTRSESGQNAIKRNYIPVPN